MRPLKQFQKSDRAAIRGVFVDIDETLTSGGHLTVKAYSALEALLAARAAAHRK